MSEDEKILMQLEQEWSLEKAYQQELVNRENLGIKKGLKQGIEKGIYQTKKSMVKKLSEIGMDIEKIACIVELPKEEVIKIQEEL